jgi:hypothetical protein
MRGLDARALSLKDPNRSPVAMNFPRTSKLTSLAALTAAASFVVACGASVDPIGGGQGGGGGEGDDVAAVTSVSSGEAVGTTSSSNQGGGSGVGGSGDGGAGVGGENPTAVGGGSPGSESIALFGDELPPIDGEGGGTSSVSVGAGGAGGAPGFDEDRLYLFVSRDPQSCGDPFAQSCATNTFEAVIGLPPEYQTEGVYELSDPAIIANFSEAGPGGKGECFGGGGSFFSGTIEVLLIDDTAVRIELAGTSPSNLEGEHLVLRCGDEPIEGNQIAYFPSDLPDGGSGPTSGVGPGGGEEAFVLDFGDHPQSCSDPFDPPGPGETHHDFLIYLPPEYLTPGVYPLDDPNISTGYYEMEENVAAVSGGGPSRPGTLTIFEVNDSYVDLQLEGTSYPFANGLGQVPRCAR